jgi:hypothetical protein
LEAKAGTNYPLSKKLYTILVVVCGVVRLTL